MRADLVDPDNEARKESRVIMQRTTCSTAHMAGVLADEEARDRPETKGRRAGTPVMGEI